MKSVSSLLLLSLGLALPYVAQSAPEAAPAPIPVPAVLARNEPAYHARVVDLLSRMTLEEKIGQLVQYSAPGHATGPAAVANVEREVSSGRAGSMLNVVGVKETRAMQELAVKRTRLGIPLLFGYDVIHGFRTIFPINLGQAASWDIQAIERSERIAATEASAAGVNWTFAPMLDIARDPRWGRISEGAGEDPYLASAIGVARVHGFQGDDLSRSDTILACAKHFVGYGAAQGGRDYNTTDLSAATLRDIYFPPFKSALDAGVSTFMAAFNDLNGVPCSANPALFDQVLRREWGFRGFVVSDWTSIKELVNHGIAADLRDAARQAFNAGIDMDMESRAYMPNIGELVIDGSVNLQRLDQAVYTVLMAKARLGLFDDPFRYCDENREKQAILTKANLEAARSLARSSCVLLQNDRAALPLKKGVRIALIGPLADSPRDLIGSWQAQGREQDTLSIKQAFIKANGGEIVYAEGCQVKGSDRSGIAEAVKIAKRATTVVVVLGESWDMSGESSSRTNLELPGLQLDLLKELHATGRPIVAVVLGGRPLVLSEVRKYTDAILFAWFPGTMGGPAIVDLLTGAYSPSGKLPVTFPRVVGQVPLYYNHKPTGRPQDDGKPTEKFLSNYLDSPNTPEFPFGYGLSYSRFEYSKARLSSPVLRPDGTLKVVISVSNKGRMAADEVVQLYVRDVVGSVTRPVRELKGFARVSLRVGETRELSFILRPEDLAFTHLDMSVAPEAGRFELFIGGDSLAPKVGEFEYQEL